VLKEKSKIKNLKREESGMMNSCSSLSQVNEYSPVKLDPFDQLNS
jgi:hypothetical protein